MLMRLSETAAAEEQGGERTGREGVAEKKKAREGSLRKSGVQTQKYSGPLRMGVRRGKGEGHQEQMQQ